MTYVYSFPSGPVASPSIRVFRVPWGPIVDLKLSGHSVLSYTVFSIHSFFQLHSLPATQHSQYTGILNTQYSQCTVSSATQYVKHSIHNTQYPQLRNFPKTTHASTHTQYLQLHSLLSIVSSPVCKYTYTHDSVYMFT